MKILIELPTWLGDSVMATPAIENVIKIFENVEITLIGSNLSIESIKNHPKVVKAFILDKKYYNLYKIIKGLENYDIFISFRSSLRSKFIKFFVSSDKKFQFDKKKFDHGHQVEKYNNFINKSLNITTVASNLLFIIALKKIKIRKIKFLE